MTDHDDRLYVQHITVCLNNLAEDVPTREHFFNDRTRHDAALRNLQTMAESTQRLSGVLKSAVPQIDWKGWSGFRNVLTHGYTTLNDEEVWEIIEMDLPLLRAAIDDLRRACGL